MSVVDCPVCGHRVNADAIHCPECGADPRLSADQAGAELATRHLVPTPGPPGQPLPQWSRRRRILVLIPGLVLPVACAVLGVIATVVGARDYFSVPFSERLAQEAQFGEPLDLTMGLGVVLVLAALFLAALALGAALPRRLDSGTASIVLIGSLLVLGLVAVGAVLASGWFGLFVCLPFAYVPALTAVRLLLQSSARGSSSPRQTGLARPTSAST
jgi:hypothetical protein